MYVYVHMYYKYTIQNQFGIQGPK